MGHGLAMSLHMYMHTTHVQASCLTLNWTVYPSQPHVSRATRCFMLETALRKPLLCYALLETSAASFMDSSIDGNLGMLMRVRAWCSHASRSRRCFWYACWKLMQNWLT